MGYHLIFGKVDPEDHHPHWNLMVEIDDDRPAIFIQEILDAGNLAKEIEELRPQHIVYDEFKSALKKYRSFQANGGWEPIPAGPTLKKGMQDGRVLLLRKRLQITGDFATEASESEIFDDPLEQAVKRFQARHHLTTDGSVGKQTLETLNVPVENRIDQIRINLERTRWVLHAISGQFVIVDIAGFEVFVYKDNEIVWTSRVQVGRPYRQTPVFKSEIKYLDLNPTWTIPPGILAKDTLPAVKKDRNYLKDRNIKVIDRTGKAVNQDTIDWSKYTGRNFPYQLRQDPGPGFQISTLFLFTTPPANPCLNAPIAPLAPAVSVLKSPLNSPKFYWTTPTSGTRKALSRPSTPDEPKRSGFPNRCRSCCFTGRRLWNRTALCVLKKIRIKEMPRSCRA